MENWTHWIHIYFGFICKFTFSTLEDFVWGEWAKNCSYILGRTQFFNTNVESSPSTGKHEVLLVIPVHFVVILLNTKNYIKHKLCSCWIWHGLKYISNEYLLLLKFPLCSWMWEDLCLEFWYQTERFKFPWRWAAPFELYIWSFEHCPLKIGINLNKSLDHLSIHLLL